MTVYPTFTFWGGERVETSADWQRRAEIRRLYQYYMYGMPDPAAETVSYRIGNNQMTITVEKTAQGKFSGYDSASDRETAMPKTGTR